MKKTAHRVMGQKVDRRFATLAKVVRVDLPGKVNFGLRSALWEGTSHANIWGKSVLSRGRCKGPEAGRSGKASGRAWGKKGCVNWVWRNEWAFHSQREGKGEALVRSGGPGKCMVGGSAAFVVQSGWKTGSGVRLGAEEVAEHGLERWEDHAEFWTSWFWPLRSPCWSFYREPQGVSESYTGELLGVESTFSNGKSGPPCQSNNRLWWGELG